MTDGERSAGAQERGDSRVARVRVEPVERGEGDDGVEVCLLRPPVLEVGVHDLDVRERRKLAWAIAASFVPSSTHVCGTRARRGNRRLPRAAADLADPRAGADPFRAARSSKSASG